MKLSIITVNLNNKNGLQKTIDSVVSQTFKDFEWIVIDGGSIDGSRELIEQYADHF
ncbi:MAG: glycosyltransferase, partial [Alphaproteobacteria bacterium]|nr:glycosyltransferase [Alphaproteobacteria bacterium]